MKSAEQIQYNAIWTDNIDNKSIHDFLEVQNKVFHSAFNENSFKRKYTDNIYGSSVIVLAYFKRKCIGARAFWRNDITGTKAYQPCDTAVLEEYRGLGVFSGMTQKALDTINGQVLLYNFPNDRSLSGYVKMGWKLSGKRRYKLYNPYKDNLSIEKIEKNYLKWLLAGRNVRSTHPLYYTRMNKTYYLIKKRLFNLYVIIAQIEEADTKNLSKAMLPVCLLYSDKGFLGRGIVSVIRNSQDDIQIPLYKIDTLF